MVVMVAVGVTDLVVHHLAIMAQFAGVVAHFVTGNAGGAFVAMRTGDGQAFAIVAEFGAVMAHFVAGGGNCGGLDRLGIGHGRGNHGSENGGSDNGEDELAHGGNSLIGRGWQTLGAERLGVSVGHEAVMARSG